MTLDTQNIRKTVTHFSIKVLFIVLVVGGVGLGQLAKAELAEDLVKHINKAEFTEGYALVEANKEAIENSDDPTLLIAASQALSYYGNNVLPDNLKRVFDDAYDYALKAIELAPNNADAHFEAGRARGFYATATSIVENLNAASTIKEHFDKTLELDPSYTAGYIALGSWHVKLIQAGVAWMYGGKREAALENLEKATTLSPDIGSYVALAEAYHDLEEDAKALEMLDAAAAIRPRHALDALDLEKAEKFRAEWQ